MPEEKVKPKKQFLAEGPISPDTIAKSIAAHSTKKNIGAHEIFLGQVRQDIIEGKLVQGIEYSAYREMAEEAIENIREEGIVKHKLACSHILHSQGLIKTGEICFFVFVSSAHRQASFDACREMVDRIKKEVPIFGKEIFEDGGYVWKENKF